MFGRRFESAHLHKRNKLSLAAGLISFVETPLNPCHFVTSPFRGMPPSAVLQSGVPAASICLADLADADGAALMLLMMSQLEQHCVVSYGT